MTKSTKFNTLHPDELQAMGPDGCAVSHPHASFYEETGFTIVPNWLIDHDKLTAEATLILITILRNKQGFQLWDSRMMQRLHCGRDAFYKTINNLAEHGFISYEYTRGPGGVIVDSKRIIAPKPIFPPIIKRKKGVTTDNTDSLKTRNSVKAPQVPGDKGCNDFDRIPEKPKFGKPGNSNNTNSFNNTNSSNKTKLNNTQKKNLMVNDVQLDAYEAWEDFYELWKGHRVDKAESFKAFLKSLKEAHVLDIMVGARAYHGYLATLNACEVSASQSKTKKQQSSAWLNKQRWLAEYPVDDAIKADYVHLNRHKFAHKTNFLSRLDAEKLKRVEIDVTPGRPRLLSEVAHD